MLGKNDARRRSNPDEGMEMTELCGNIASPTIRRAMTLLAHLDELQRHRVLDALESALVERLVRKTMPPRETWRWSAKEDRRLIAFMRRRAVGGRPAPFKPNDEVRKIAAEFGRSYMAVHRRMERLRKREKCSDVSKRQLG